METWCHPKGTSKIDNTSETFSDNISEDIAPALLRVCGPAHVSPADGVWSELLLSYKSLAHVARDGGSTLELACKSMARHCRDSSNLAAMSLRVSRMVLDMEDATQTAIKKVDNNAVDKTEVMISLAGKARVSCGALNLFRILCHEIIVRAKEEGMTGNTVDGLMDGTGGALFVEKAFMYRPRNSDVYNVSLVGKGSKQGLEEVNTSLELVNSLLSFLSTVTNITLKLMETMPELYDTVVQCLELLLVLLSTQLYQKVKSSSQWISENVDLQNSNGTLGCNFFLDLIMEEAHRTRVSVISSPPQRWSTQTVLTVLLKLLASRPPPPPRSISYHACHLARIIAEDFHDGGIVGSGNMYEDHTIVHARAIQEGEFNAAEYYGDKARFQHHSYRNATVSGTRMILDTPARLLRLSSSLLMFPLRLLVVAMSALGGVGEIGRRRRIEHQSTDDNPVDSGSVKRRANVISKATHNAAKYGMTLTKDVLWISDSPAADLGCAIFLILTNNYRAGSKFNNGNVSGYHGNPFRSDLASLDDNRWGDWRCGVENDKFGERDTISHSLPSTTHSDHSFPNSSNVDESSHRPLLYTNFECLFTSFGATVHTEIGALTLYTLIQSSPIFAASLAARSDLDTAILPLLRTLYFSTSLNCYVSGKTLTSVPPSTDINATSSMMVSDGVVREDNETGMRVLQKPFRSHFQLYLIVILLLIFSQDTSFGPDSFRRIHLPSVPWYKERRLKDVSLGSLVVLSLLRCITFSLNRLHDPFLLSNCGAVLSNLAPHVESLHEYAAMRLASVTVSSMKRLTMLSLKSRGKKLLEKEISEEIAMYNEMIKRCFHSKVIMKNLDLVYALVYLQRDFNIVVKAKHSPFKSSSDVEFINLIVHIAYDIIQKGSVRTAEEAMGILKSSVNYLTNPESVSFSLKESSPDDVGDFSFSYQEVPDPEIFFVPYIWEVIVCTITASSLEWDKERIGIFPLLHMEKVKSESELEPNFMHLTASVEDTLQHESNIDDSAKNSLDMV